jgi:erythromycin esterase
MDSQLTGNYSFSYLLSDLQARLKSKGSSLPDDAFWPVFSDLTSKLLRMQRDEPEPSVQAQYFRFVGHLKSSFSAEPDYFWHRVILSIENQAQRYWGLRPEQRSGVMGENLKSLIEHRYPRKKIIVWGQYVHLNRAGLPNGGNVGYAIAQLFGETADVVHFTGNRGTFYNFFEEHNVPIVHFPLKTIESLLEKQPGPYNFTDWRNLPRRLREDKTISASMFHYFPDGFLTSPQAGLPPWNRQVDGTFYLDHITSPKP